MVQRMNLYPHRAWITPIVIGAFLLSAATGVLMFFHLDSGLNKTAHEWLSWAMVIGVLLHLAVHFTGFKRYFSQTAGRWIVGAFALMLALSFIPLSQQKQEPAFAPPVRALSAAPLPVLAQVVGVSAEELQQRLSANGFTVKAGQTSLQDVVGPDLRAQINALKRITATKG